MKRLAAITVSLLLVLCCGFTASAATLDNMPYDSYTYWQEDSAKYLVGSRTMYEFEGTVTGEELGVGAFGAPNDIVAGEDGRIYVLDSKNSRVIVIKDGAAEKVLDSTGEKFEEASGIAVGKDGTVYIADTENMRVLAVTPDGTLGRIITCPDAEIIPEDFEFRPLQMTIDKNGYLYVLSKGSFYGALVFAPDGATEGFFGANKVNASVGDILDTLWNRWFMTDEQRASQIQKIPFQFSDLSIDETGLLFTTTGATTSSSTQYGQIRCLGPSGVNVMKARQGRKSVSADSFNFADNKIADLAVNKRVQNFVSVDIEDGFVYALDQTYGKVYVYTTDCELLTVFGGGVKKGTQKGTFETASALAVNGDRIYVADSKKGNIAVFKINDYGAAVKEAATLTDGGKYEAAKPLWEEIVKLDRNSQLAYRGLARAALAAGKYGDAMDYAKKGTDRGIYDQAFEYVRNAFLQKHINLIVFAAVVIAAAIVLLVILSKKGKIPKIKLPRLSLALRAWRHPFDNIRAVRYKNQGSVLIAAVLLALFYVSDVLKDFYSGFAHSTFNVENYNSLLTLIGTVGVVILWVCCNWAISVLAEGKGKIKEVFIVACYSLVPMIFGNVLYMICSNVLLIKEAAVLSVISTLSLILTGLTLCIGTMIVHEFDFFKFLFTAAISIIAMAIVIFLAFMVVILLQQFFAFIKTVFIEVAYR